MKRTSKNGTEGGTDSTERVPGERTSADEYIQTKAKIEPLRPKRSETKVVLMPVTKEVEENYRRLAEKLCLFENTTDQTQVAPRKLRRTQRFLMKAIDIVASLVILFLATPLMLIVSVFIKMIPRGPVFYRSTYLGKNGKTFTLYKFRTMIKGAEKLGPGWTAKNDPRVTKIGGVLRRSRLDELPIFFNVLLGDMSLVGPRPQPARPTKMYAPWQKKRLSVKPGLTGLTQIKEPYELKPEHSLRIDSIYIQKRSLLLNIWTIFKSIPLLFTRKRW